MSNLILLRHLAEIALTKRIDDGRAEEVKKMHWKVRALQTNIEKNVPSCL